MARLTMEIRMLFALMAVACLPLAGCDGGSDLPLVPVRGQITFAGGPPPHEGRVLFAQIPGSGVIGLPNRPARSGFALDGKFTATSFQEGDGLLPGRYRVTIVCMDGEPGPTRNFDQITFVPPDYQPDELVVEQGSAPIVVNYDVPPKKK